MGLGKFIGRGGATGSIVATIFLVELIVVLAALVLAAAHAHITADADTAALLGNHAAEGSALGETRELLGREDGEGRRLDFGTVGDEVVAVEDDVGILWVQILDLAQVLEQGKAEAVFALVTDRQVREDEVAGGSRTVEVGHACHRSASQDRKAGRRGRGTAWGDSAGILKTGVKEEVGVVAERDFLVILEDAQLDNRRWVDGATVGARLCAATTGSGAFWLLDNLEVVANRATILGGADGRAFGLVGDCDG